MARLFGTDGVRGIANEKLTCELALAIGMAGTAVLTSEVRAPRILVGADTRKSCDMLSAALVAGICSMSGDALLLGVIPTPGVAYLTRLYKADAAVMISASHNSMEYNGIKWFDSEGYKLSDEVEDRIEAIVNGEETLARPTGGDVGRLMHMPRATEEYMDFLKEAAAVSLSGMSIALDCANGASSYIAKDLFTALGAKVHSFGDEPDGYNINEKCGSTYPESLQRRVCELGADIGLAFDGDADRLIAIDERGALVDGDRILGILALAMKEEKKLKDDTLVITVMSNLGLKNRMKDAGISIEETAVGDRYVLERMLEKGYNLGGEQSGHVILLDHHTTGDGLLSAVALLNVLMKSGKRMSKLSYDIPIYPQVLVNVIVDEAKKNDALNDEELIAASKNIEDKLQGKGRVLIRASGTEPLIRIMLEGQSEKEISQMAVDLANVLKRKHGGRIKH